MIGEYDLMDINEFEEWIKNYYKKRGWADLDIFIRIGFLVEETGELARSVRALEIGRDRPDEVTESLNFLRQELIEELGDVFGNLIIIAQKYDIKLEDIFHSHRNKLDERYSQSK